MVHWKQLMAGWLSKAFGVGAVEAEVSCRIFYAKGIAEATARSYPVTTGRFVSLEVIEWLVLASLSPGAVHSRFLGVQRAVGPVGRLQRHIQ